MLYFQPKGKRTNLAAALEYLNKVISRRAVVFVISDFLAPDYTKPLTVASRRHDLVAMPVLDPGEERLPDVGLVTFEDAETGEQIEINTSSSAVRQRVRRRRGAPAQESRQTFRLARNRCRAACNQRGLPCRASRIFRETRKEAGRMMPTAAAANAGAHPRHCRPDLALSLSGVGGRRRGARASCFDRPYFLADTA